MVFDVLAFALPDPVTGAIRGAAFGVVLVIVLNVALATGRL